ncbi:hypothetical protein GGI35DRAFT_295855 [Trichoderma velutinum]
MQIRCQLSLSCSVAFHRLRDRTQETDPNDCAKNNSLMFVVVVMVDPPRYEIDSHVTNTREDDNDARFTVRRNDKVFYIKLSPCNFINSPTMI